LQASFDHSESSQVLQNIYVANTPLKYPEKKGGAYSIYHLSSIIDHYSLDELIEEEARKRGGWRADGALLTVISY
jgi:hypothetical protein